MQEDKIVNYLKENEAEFQSILFSEAEDVASKITLILEEGNIDLLKNAQRIAYDVIRGEQKEIVSFGAVEGKAWAMHALTLELKLEWIHAIRRALWIILCKLNSSENAFETEIDFFKLEKKINDGIDEFLNSFFISYSKYKDELLLDQRKLVEHLTVPIIPLSENIAVLPLIGRFDSYRTDIVEAKVLHEIMRLEIDTLIIDLSGIPEINEYNLASFERIIKGVDMMGAKLVLTGIRPQIAKKIVGDRINPKIYVQMKGSLQTALNEFLPVG